MGVSFARLNARECPYWSTVLLGVFATGLAAISTLESLVGVASLGFFVIFCFVDALAFRQIGKGRWISAAGSIGAGGAAIVVARQLLRENPTVFGVLAGSVAVGLLGSGVASRRTRR